MGIIHRGIPEKMGYTISRRHNLHVLVETGTHVGRTALWGAQHFDVVFTIESDEDYLRQAGVRCRGYDNITFLLGDSVARLPDVLLQLTRPALFWLDAHWSPDLHSERPQVICPVLAELAMINESKYRNAIMVDDARLFTNNNHGWPELSEVISMMKYKGKRAVTIRDDVIIGEPIG